jgi:hypothetical protein
MGIHIACMQQNSRSAGSASTAQHSYCQKRYSLLISLLACLSAFFFHAKALAALSALASAPASAF